MKNVKGIKKRFVFKSTLTATKLRLFCYLGAFITFQTYECLHTKLVDCAVRSTNCLKSEIRMNIRMKRN